MIKYARHIDAKSKPQVLKIVNVGIFGEVTLSLCRNCVPKFDDSVVTKKGLQNQSLPVNRKKGLFNEYRVSTA